MMQALAPMGVHGSEVVARAWLARGGVRATRPRLTLARLLVGDGQHRHISAEALLAATTTTGEPVSVATVYNALRRFAASGLLREIRIHSGSSHFDTRVDDHAHFYWPASGVIKDAPSRLVATDLPPPPLGTRIAGVDVIIRLEEEH